MINKKIISIILVLALIITIFVMSQTYQSSFKENSIIDVVPVADEEVVVPVADEEVVVPVADEEVVVPVADEEVVVPVADEEVVFPVADEGPSWEVLDVKYGPHERNLLDFWRAESNKPTPVVVFMHAGGFVGGDKSAMETANNSEIREEFLKNGISVAAINYPLIDSSTIDEIHHSATRSIQFIRHMSDDWNIDKERIGVYGGSAGGGLALWIGVRDDMADKTSEDPVKRESTRIQVVGHKTSQATNDFEEWSKVVGVDKEQFDSMFGKKIWEFFHVNSDLQYNQPEILQMRQDINSLNYFDSTDPPIFLENLNPNIESEKWGKIVHHPKHAIFIKELCDENNIECELSLRENPNGDRPKLTDFFIKHLTK